MIRYGGLLCLLVSQIAFAQGPDAGTVDAGTVEAGSVDAGTVDSGTVVESRALALPDGGFTFELAEEDKDALGADIETVLKESEDPDTQVVEQADASRVTNCLQKTEGQTEFCIKAWEACTSNVDVASCTATWDLIREDVRAALVEKEVSPQTVIGPSPVPVVVSPLVIQTLEECVENNACTDLWWLKESKGDAYRRIRLWCDNNKGKPARKPASIANVCEAIEAYHGNTGREEVERRWKLDAEKARVDAAERDVLVATENLDKVLGDTLASKGPLRDASQAFEAAKENKADMWRAFVRALGDHAVANPKDLRALETDVKTTFKSFLEAGRDAAAKRKQYVKLADETLEVKRARIKLKNAMGGLSAARTALEAARSADEASARELKRVDRYELLRFQDTLSRPIYSCGGWGIVLPLFSARKPTGAAWDVKGPVTSGVGGGYYFDWTCDADSSLGISLFGYSEGLDPGEKLHFAVGASVSITAFKYFGFGVGLGYDLFRFTPAIDGAPARTTGLFPDGYRQDNVSLLFTFSLKSESETRDETTNNSPDNEAGAETRTPPRPDAPSAGGGGR